MFIIHSALIIVLGVIISVVYLNLPSQYLPYICPFRFRGV